MKKILLAFVLLGIAIPSIAQIASGSKFINGTLRLTAVGGDGSGQTAFTLNPTFGYFINDRTAVGGSLGIISQSSENTDNNLTIFLSPFVRRYFTIVDDAFYFFVDGSVAFSYGNSAASFGEFFTNEDVFSLGLSASPGFAYFPAEKWGIDFTFTGLGLTFFGLGSEGGTTTLFTLGVTTFSPSLGFSYFF